MAPASGGLYKPYPWSIGIASLISTSFTLPLFLGLKIQVSGVFTCHRPLLLFINLFQCLCPLIWFVYLTGFYLFLPRSVDSNPHPVGITIFLNIRRRINKQRMNGVAMTTRCRHEVIITSGCVMNYYLMKVYSYKQVIGEWGW